MQRIDTVNPWPRPSSRQHTVLAELCAANWNEYFPPATTAGLTTSITYVSGTSDMKW